MGRVAAVSRVVATERDSIQPAYILRDTFTDTNGVDLDVHTLDTGGVWTARYSHLEVQSGKAKATTGGDNIVTKDAGTGDVDITLLYTYATGDSYAGIYFRTTTGTGTIPNTWLYYWSADGYWRLGEQTVSISNRGIFQHTPVDGQTYALRVRAQGTSIRAYLDGALRLSYTSAQHQTGQYHGFWINGSGTPQGTFDDFTLVAPV